MLQASGRAQREQVCVTALVGVVGPGRRHLARALMLSRTPRRDVKGCPYCPAVLPLKATVCNQCGRDLTRAPTREAPSQWAGHGWWMILLALGTVVGILAVMR